MAETKTCTKCGVEKGLGEFYERVPGVFISICKACKRAQAASWYADNKDMAAERSRRPEVRARKNAARNADYAALPDREKAIHIQKLKEWCEKNPQAHKDAIRAWRASHPEACRLAAKKSWAKAGPERRSRKNQRARQRRLADPSLARQLDKQIYERERFELTNRYVLMCLRQGTSLSSAMVPQSIIEAKREHLRLVRLLKEKQK